MTDASIWRQVQETIYQRWASEWGSTTLFCLGNEQFDPPNSQWAKVQVVSFPGGPGTLGPLGRRRVERAGAVYIRLREPPNLGVGGLSDLAEQARRVFEGQRLAPNDIRFLVGDIGDEASVDEGRWWGVTIEVRFGYEDWN